MRNLMAAVFLTFILCAVPANSTVLAKESSILVRPRQVVSRNRSFRDTLWEKKLKDWEKRQGAAPKSLPRVTNFKIHKHSSSRSFRSSHRSFRSSHSHIRHVRRGRSHSRRRR